MKVIRLVGWLLMAGLIPLTSLSLAMRVFPQLVEKTRGHHLQPEDLKTVIEKKPDVLVIGTGAHGIMTVPVETIKYLEEAGIEVICQPTGQAVESFNQITGRQKAAAFHLTC